MSKNDTRKVCSNCGARKSEYFDYCVTCDMRFYGKRLIRNGERSIEKGKSILETLAKEAQQQEDTKP